MERLVCTLREATDGGTYGLGLPSVAEDTGHPYLRTTDMISGTIDWSALPYCDATPSQYVDASLRDGDIVISRTGANAGAAALVRRPPGGAVFAGYLVRFRANPDIADSRYLGYVLRSELWNDYVRNSRTGSAQPQFNARLMGAFQLALPPLDEQKRIAGVLGALDDLIETNTRTIGAVLELSRSEYAALAARAPVRVPLGDVAIANAAQVKPGSTSQLRYVDIAALGDGSVSWGDPISWAEAPSRARRATALGDTLWSCVRPNLRAHGPVTRDPREVVVSTGIVTLTPKSVGPAFLFASTDSEEFVALLSRLADGGAYPAVRPDSFTTAMIPMPDEPRLREFENRLWPLWLAAGALTEEIDQLRSTRDELLPLLMSGKVSPGEVAV